MFEQVRWQRAAWIPVAAGLLWFLSAARSGPLGFAMSLIPGCLLLSSGVSTLLYPGDSRIPQFVALGGVLGVVMGLPALFGIGWGPGGALLALSAASFVAAGTISVRQEPHVEEVPTPERSLGLAAQVALDDAILATLTLRLPPTLSRQHASVRAEVHQARGLFRDRGWLDDPAAYHRLPPALDDVSVRPARWRRLEYEHLQFVSGYEPHSDEPGRERWLDRRANRTAHAWLLRHRSGPRPWLICIHGYEMGIPGLDLAAFRAARLHHRHGLNVVLPVLPLHGPRKIGRRSGEGFLSGDFLDTVHAEAQAMWDLRRLLSWIRAQQAPAVGVYGLSLGGYNAALLAALEDLACAIAGIPAVDFARLTWRHGAPLEVRFAEHHGLVHDEVAEMFTVISPLALAPRVPPLRRYIFAGVADRIVPAEQARDLWRHWERGPIAWYQGAHVTFRLHPQVEALVMTALRDAQLIG